MRFFLRALLLVSFCFVSVKAFAFNYQPYPIGERASGIGGAYIALSEDGSGCYYNPAGLVFSEFDRISISGNVYGLSRMSIHDTRLIGERPEDVRTDSYFAHPTSFATVYRFSGPGGGAKKNAMGFSIMTPHNFSYRVQTDFKNIDLQLDSTVEDKTYWVGPSYSRLITPGFSIGGSLYGLLEQYSYRSVVHGTLTPKDLPALTGDLNFVSSESDTRTLGNILGIVGAKYKIQQLNLGAVIQTPSAQVYGKGQYQGGDFVAYETEHDDSTDSISFQPTRKDPWVFGFGIAFQDPELFTVSADLRYYTGNSYDDADKDAVAEKIKTGAITNFNLGSEYLIKNLVPLRAGYFTNYSPIRLNSESTIERIDMQGLTFATGLVHKRTSVSLGLVYTFGDGRLYSSTLRQNSQGAIVTDREQVRFEAQTYSLMLATTYSFGGD